VDADDLEALASQAAAGDGAAFAAFVRATQADVRRFCAALVDLDSADDLAQETYVRAHRSLPTFDGQATVRTWLLGVARHVCLTEIRTRNRRRRLWRAPQRFSEADPTGAVDLWDCVRRLPPERREAFVLTQLLGFSYSETSDICRCPVGTVRSRVARARDDLQAMVTGTASNSDFA
jgi:RNA polymerase sigma-70 factor (ECF subfamily)